MRNDLHVTGIRLKNFLTWKKRLLICTVFVLIDLKLNVRHDRPLCKKHVFRSKHIFACVSGVYYKTEESRME